mmetsp:Transcript_79274/g.236203  ORF Transcript_79274/g.236203 Transcript_79274/m.236203 type:complete len:233 (+) Transcript_79274:873-1571(+)
MHHLAPVPGAESVWGIHCAQHVHACRHAGPLLCSRHCKRAVTGHCLLFRLRRGRRQARPGELPRRERGPPGAAREARSDRRWLRRLCGVSLHVPGLPAQPKLPEVALRGLPRVGEAVADMADPGQNRLVLGVRVPAPVRLFHFHVPRKHLGGGLQELGRQWDHQHGGGHHRYTPRRGPHHSAPGDPDPGRCQSCDRAGPEGDTMPKTCGHAAEQLDLGRGFNLSVSGRPFCV